MCASSMAWGLGLSHLEPGLRSTPSLRRGFLIDDHNFWPEKSGVALPPPQQQVQDRAVCGCAACGCAGRAHSKRRRLLCAARARAREGPRGPSRESRVASPGRVRTPRSRPEATHLRRNVTDKATEAAAPQNHTHQSARAVWSVAAAPLFSLAPVIYFGARSVLDVREVILLTPNYKTSF